MAIFRDHSHVVLYTYDTPDHLTDEGFEAFKYIFSIIQ